MFCHRAHRLFAFLGILPLAMMASLQNTDKSTKSGNAMMLPLALQDGHRHRKRHRRDAMH